MNKTTQSQTTTQLETEGYQNFDINLLAGRIGAEIVGLSLKQTLTDETVQEIRQALIKHKVIFFRQQHLDGSEQIAFAQRFGNLTNAHPIIPSLPGYPEIFDFDYGRIENRTNQWHSDVTFIDRPPYASILRAVEIPPVGGDTMWANTVTAYQDLPAPLRILADQLWAVHSNTYTDYPVATVSKSENRQEFEKVFISTEYQTLHPVVCIHPESGERGLLLGAFVRQFKDLSVNESGEILQLFQSYITRPENTVRWRWQEGDIAFWDNRVTQHYGINDFGSQPRRVQRVTLVGDLAIGINGTTSKAIKGDSSTYNKLNQIID